MLNLIQSCSAPATFEAFTVSGLIERSHNFFNA
jgi:hypothetical protein